MKKCRVPWGEGFFLTHTVDTHGKRKLGYIYMMKCMCAVVMILTSWNHIKQ